MDNLESRLSQIESQITQLSRDIKSLDSCQKSNFDYLISKINKIIEIVSYCSRK